MISQEIIQQVMHTARVEEVISVFVELKKRGKNMIGKCPFHDDTNMSFTLSPEKNIYKCFGCGKGGDSVRFIMDYMYIGFPNAIQYLANKYKINIGNNNYPYLLPVPQKQKDWLNKVLFGINNDILPTECVDIQMLKNNILGNNDRFIGYNGNSMGLLESFWMSFTCGYMSQINTLLILNMMEGLIKMSTKKEYYEIAFNTKSIHTAIKKHIEENDAEGNNDKPFVFNKVGPKTLTTEDIRRSIQGKH